MQSNNLYNKLYFFCDTKNKLVVMDCKHVSFSIGQLDVNLRRSRSLLPEAE